MGALWLPHRKADVLVRYAQIFDCGAIFIYQLYDSYAWCDVKQIMAHCPLITAGRNEARDGSGPHEQQEEVFLVCEEYLNRLEMRP